MRYTYNMPFDGTWNELWDVIKDKIYPKTKVFRLTVLQGDKKKDFNFKISHIKEMCFNELQNITHDTPALPR